MVRIVAVVIIAALLTPSAAVAGPLLEAAMRKAAEIRPTVVEQPMGCAAATAAGQDLADRREGSGGYLAGGIFIPVIMPLIGMAASPTAPAAEIANLDDADVACFQDGYRERGRSKKVRAGWIGSGIGIGLYVVLVAVAAAQGPTYNRF